MPRCWSPPPADAQSTVAPAITSVGPFSVDEGATAVATLTAEDTDTTSDNLTWSKSGGDDAAAFSLSSTGVLSFSAAKDFENPDDADSDGSYLVTVKVSDGDNSDTADLVVTIENVTELQATITGPTDVAFAENAATRVATFTASSEQDRDGVEWVLGGTDAAHFNVDTPAGALRFDISPDAPKLFAQPPDFEDPADADENNVYSITLRARVGTTTTTTITVTVTVTDVDEAGAITLSTTHPRAGTELTATLTDPDEVTDGSVTWKWERSTGRNAWAEIAGASASSYTPAAADTNAFLRVTATYDDESGSGKSARAVVPHVVRGPTLSSLSVTTTNTATRPMYPRYAPEVLHYAVGCVDVDTMTITLAATAAETRLVIHGELYVNPGAGQPLTASVKVTPTSVVQVLLSGADGASTNYILRCLPIDFATITTTKAAGAEGVIDDLIMFPWGKDRDHCDLVIVDNNGVPRFLRRLSSARCGSYFRVFPDGRHPSGYIERATTGTELVALDKEFREVQRVSVVHPLSNTDGHDFMILPNGDFALLSYESAVRDFSFIPEADVAWFLQQKGVSYQAIFGRHVTKDSAIQIRTPSGTSLFTWNSWDHMAKEDCTPHRFLDGYAHVNSLDMVDGDIVASFRGCSKVLRIDVDTGDVVWRVGRSTRSEAEWTGGETSGNGPAALEIVNDPYGEFCGQHAAQILPNGNLLLFDNGAPCYRNPANGHSFRTSSVFSRGVEYAIDTINGEVVFVRHHSLHSAFTRLGWSNGHVDPLGNGDWLISWGRYSPAESSSGSDAPDEAVTQVNPDTGEEKFSLTVRNPADPSSAGVIRAVPLSPEALAPQQHALTASIPSSTHTSVFHSGSTDTPQVVVAFSRPVVDFATTSPSLSVTGATVASVSAHLVAGEPAHAYLISLTPAGDGAITFRLVANQPCADGGICTADGTTLSDVPTALVIGPPVTVSLGGAAYSVREGSTLAVPVHLSTAHRGVGGVTIPISVNPTGATPTDDYSGAQSVTFEAGHSQRSVSIMAWNDDLVEGPEVLTLSFGALPTGVTRGSVASTEITLTDADRAAFRFEVSTIEVAEGGEMRVTFKISNGVTFQGDQQINLTISGTATRGDDFTVPEAITLPARTSSANVTLRVLDDTEMEPVAETISLSATLASTKASLGTRTITIPPSDVPDTPVVTVSAGSDVTEGTDASFELSRTDALSAPVANSLTVPIRVTATGSTLSGRAPTTATFAENSSTTSVQVGTLDDDVVEPPSEVTVLALADLHAPILYLVGPMNSATVTVNDNDLAAFSVAADSTEVAEGSSVRVTVETVGLTFADEQAVTLTLAGTATAGEDFTVAARNGDDLLPPYRFLLPAGASSTSVTIGAARDAWEDAGETIEVSISYNGSVIGVVTITITETAPQPVVAPAITGGGGGPAGPAPSDLDFEWTVQHDIEALAAGHDRATGMWSDGATLSLAHNGDGADDAIYAYDLESGERVEEREFELDERNRAPRGVWSDGETLWIADSGRDTLFAHDLASGERLPERDIVLHDDNSDARGIWSADGIMWVLDSRGRALFAYDLASGDLLGEFALDSANGDPHGLWSDGVAIWVSDHGEKDLLAYQLPATGAADEPVEAKLERVRNEDFTKLSRASNNSPRGIWSDGDFMYVVDASDGRVYSYNMPDAIDARLATLSLSGVEIGEFDRNRTDYEGVIAEGVSESVVTAEATQRRTDVVIDPPDADEEAEGYQVALEGLAEIIVTVTSANGTRERTYRVSLPEAGWNPASDPWPHCLRGAIAEGFSLVVYEGGSLEDLADCAQSRSITAFYALHAGVYVSYILGAPEFVNRKFRELFADDVPAITPLVAGSGGPPSADPFGDELDAEDQVPWPECIRGSIAEGFSVVVFEGGSVEDLAACAKSHGVTAVYALTDGEWVAYILGAPEFVNRQFAELFVDGLPVLTPLAAKSDLSAGADASADAKAETN